VLLHERCDIDQHHEPPVDLIVRRLCQRRALTALGHGDTLASIRRPLQVVNLRHAVATALLGLIGTITFSVIACGNDEGQIRIFAASSLQDVLPELLDAYAATDDKGPTFVTQYGGSQALATQIELGAEMDLFLAANLEQMTRIELAGRVERSTAFAANRLVIVVANDSTIATIEDLAQPGTRIAIGAPDVPVGALARTALGALDPDVAAAILKNVASEDPNVRVALSRVELGAVHAAFVYRSDSAAARHVRAVELPESLGVPANQYIGAVIAEARLGTDALLDFLASDEAQAILASAGFEAAE
jgi:molybdate transport system substrate-binding protein